MGVEEKIGVGPKGKKSKREKRNAEGVKEFSKSGNVEVQDSKTVLGKEAVMEKNKGDANEKMKKTRKKENVDTGDGNIKGKNELDYGRSLSQEGDREVMGDVDRKKKKKKKREKGEKKSLGVSSGSLVENEGDAWLVDNEMQERDGKKYGNVGEVLGKHNVAQKVEKKMKKKEKKRHKDDVNGKAVDTPGEGIEEKIMDGAERKKRKREKELTKGDLEGAKITGEHCDGEVMEKVERKKKKREKRRSMDDLGAREASGEGNLCSNDNETQDHNLKDNSKGKRKNTNLEKNGSDNPKAKRRKKKVSFSNEVEVFPLSTDSNCQKSKNGDDKLVRGKRFSPEEDEILKKAVYNYIEEHALGEEGLNMILNVKSHPEIKDCWKHIAQAIPYRPKTSIYYRAQVLFRRGEKRKWTEEDYELIRKFQEEHGNQWKVLAEELGKHRFHVKDTWRRIKSLNRKKGHWSQEEYQSLFDLVNIDLKLKLSEEKKTKHGMLRDNIHWTAISDRLSTRSDASCCLKWYHQLTSPMVAEGLWADADDYRLIKVLFTLDASCIEDVDWDNLLDHRSGDVCRKRWSQMVLHVGQHGSKSFADQVEILANRYCPDLVDVREAWDSKPVTG